MTQAQLPTSNIWMVRAEQGGIFADYFVEKGVVTIGWGVGPISATESDDSILRRVAAVFPRDRQGRHQVKRFALEVQVGDAVVTYNNGSRIYHVGIIQSPVEYGPSVHGGEYEGYARRVRWVYEVSRDALSPDTRNSLGGQLTLFRLAASASQELRQHCTGQHSISEPTEGVYTSVTESGAEEIMDPADILQEHIAKSDQFVEDAIARLDSYQLQELMAGILRAMGYRTRVAGRGPDRGFDIFASPDGLGLSEPRIFVEVKHRAGATGSPAVRSFLGGRRPGDRCLYISTGGFSADARYEAERSQIPLELVALPELRGLLVDYYETLDSATRALVPLRRVYWPVAE